MKAASGFFSLHRYRSHYDYTPIKLVLFYINMTYMLHLFLNESPTFYGFLFMIIINLFVIIGYILPSSESRNIRKLSRLNIIWEKPDIKVNQIILICSGISVLNFLNTIFAYYPSVSELAFYLKNPGQAYIYTQILNQNPDDFDGSGGFGSTVSILLTLLSATKYIFIMFTVMYWKQLSGIIRLLSVASLLLYIATSFLVGSMITIGSVLLSFIPLLLISMKDKDMIQKNKTKVVRKAKPFKIIVSIVLGLFTVLFFISNRIDGGLSEGLKVLGFYISHGYVGLDYCLELPFETTYGQSTFRGISGLLIKYGNIPDLFRYSYLARNQDANGYPALSLWSTIFPWLASDFSFSALPVIMGIISYQFSLIWNKVIRTGNPYGYLLLGQFFIFWFMVPANNQLFHTLGNSASFLVILYLYIRSKRYYIFKQNNS